jgi:hypothetical protein
MLAVIAGLDPAIYLLEGFLRSMMDTRVKPAYDESEIEVQIRAVASAAALLFAWPLSGLAATKGLRQTSFAMSLIRS